MTDRYYAQLKNQTAAVPTGTIDLGTAENRYGNLYLSGAMVLGNISATEASLNVPKISSLTFPNGASAGAPAGGETVTINGTGFLAGATVYIDNIKVLVSTVVNSTAITFTSPAKPDGNYSFSVVNADGGSATFVPGITFSDFPVFSTSAGTLGTAWEGNAVTTSVSATSDSTITFSTTAGALPTGLTLAANGAISGNLALVPSSGDTTYNFTITATDQENQQESRNFSYTVTGDTVTWVSPANNSSYSECYINTVISNIGLSASTTFGANVSYSSNTLPAGLTISGNLITGTPTTVGNVTSTITATTNNKTANLTLNFAVTNPYGQVAYTTPGTYSWVAPTGVTSVCVVCVGGGGGGVAYNNTASTGGAGADLRYVNNIAVIPGNSYTVTVGAGGLAGANTSQGNSGSPSWFSSTSTVSAMGGIGGTRYGMTYPSRTGVNTGTGGNGGTITNSGGGSGGSTGGTGAGGYSGNGGNGGAGGSTGGGGGAAGSGGGGGGGGGGGMGQYGGAGGGVGIMGEGTSGTGGAVAYSGKGGSGGTPATSTQNLVAGGTYGGGGGSRGGYSGGAGNGGGGAVRIIWGPGRSFPSTNTQDM